MSEALSITRAVHAAILPVSRADLELLLDQGYVPRKPLMNEGFAASLPAAIDREIEAGRMASPRERVVDGRATEWIISFGVIHGKGRGSAAYDALPPELRRLFEALQDLGSSYNAARASLLASGHPAAGQLPELAVESMECNVNRVVGGWSGLHLHNDRTRFTAALEALNTASVQHAALGARAFTVSGYARPLTASGTRIDDLGGALPFIVRAPSRHPGDRAVFDVVAAQHNSGAMFFPDTIHGVARMPPGSTRYSFQAFFAARPAWDEIARRIAAGELR